MESWERLKAIEVLSVLPDDALKTLAARAGERTYKKRRLLMQEGDQAEAVYFLHQGKVKLVKMNPDGQEKMVSIIQPGQMFGEISAFDNGTCPYSAETLEEVRLTAIRVSDFRDLIALHPGLAIACLRMEAKRLRKAYRHMKNLALLDTYGRVAARLFKLTREYGVPEGNGIRIQLTLTRQEMAQLIGTSRETVSRILAEYERLGILEIDRHQIVVRDVEELKRRATTGKE